VCGEEVLRWVDVFWLMLEVAFGDEGGQGWAFVGREPGQPTKKVDRKASRSFRTRTRTVGCMCPDHQGLAQVPFCVVPLTLAVVPYASGRSLARETSVLVDRGR
jgi:hypothetical protein